MLPHCCRPGWSGKDRGLSGKARRLPHAARLPVLGVSQLVHPTLQLSGEQNDHARQKAPAGVQASSVVLDQGLGDDSDGRRHVIVT